MKVEVNYRGKLDAPIAGSSWAVMNLGVGDRHSGWPMGGPEGGNSQPQRRDIVVFLTCRISSSLGQGLFRILHSGGMSESIKSMRIRAECSMVLLSFLETYTVNKDRSSKT